MTSLMTALGFLTLLTSSIGPVHDFGVYAAVGVGVAYVLAFTLLPSVMVLAPPPAISKSGTGVFWNGALHKALRWTLRNKGMLAVAWALSLAWSIKLELAADGRLFINMIHE